ncbi:MAG: hypothetical protein AAB217_09325, partial [Chloroflexota bacterium]
SGAVTPPFKGELQAWDETASPQQYRSAWAFYDGRGRTIQTQGLMESGTQLSVADTEYGPLGQTKWAGLPRLVTGAGGTYATVTWASQPKTTMTYDALGRVTKTTFADGTCTGAVYDGLSTSVFDQNLHKKEQVVDGFGRLVTVKEYSGAGGANCASAALTVYSTTSYAYDERSLLTGVTDTAGNVTTIGYDGFGRKTSMNDPDMGAWSYVYNALSQLTGQTDARGCIVNFAYDALSRITGKTYAGPAACGTTTAITYGYDSTTGGNEGLGKRTSMTDGSGSASWVYNILGQLTKETKTITGSGTFLTEWSYDAFSRLLWMKYPGGNAGQSGETVDYGYSSTGAVKSVTQHLAATPYVQSTAYDESGRITQRIFGNNLFQTNYTYFPYTTANG